MSSRVWDNDSDYGRDRQTEGWREDLVQCALCLPIDKTGFGLIRLHGRHVLNQQFLNAKAAEGDDLIDYRKSGLSARFGGRSTFEKIIDARGSQTLWKSLASYLKAGAEHNYTTVGPAMSSYSVLGMLEALGKIIYNAMVPAWLGGVPRVRQQITSFFDATTPALDKLRGLVEEMILKIETGGVWEM